MKINIPVAEAIVASAVVLCIGLSLWLETDGAGQVAWGKYSASYFYAGSMIAIGVCVRIWGRSERIAVTLIVTGLFISFTNAGATMNYLFHPDGGATIDRMLMRLDAQFGFDWLNFVFWFSDHSGSSLLIGFVYQSSLFQLLVVILFLGASGRAHKLHEFCVVGVAASLASIFIWAIVPSFGPAVIVDIPQGLSEKLRLVIDTSYTDHLNSVARGDIGTIEPGSLLGLIAFPSMHTVMALMAVCFTAGTRLFPFFVILNIPMAPAILLHGGHHLVDVFAGMVLFFIIFWPVRRLLPRFQPNSEHPDILTPPKALTQFLGRRNQG